MQYVKLFKLKQLEGRMEKNYLNWEQIWDE
jgi:hypothetical protein